MCPGGGKVAQEDSQVRGCGFRMRRYQELFQLPP